MSRLTRIRQRALARMPRGAKTGVKSALVAVRRVAPAPMVRGAERLARRTVATRAESRRARVERPTPPRGDVRLWVAPANFAGQGHAWARAAARHLDIGATSMNVAGPIRFPTDYEVPPAVYRDLTWQREQAFALTGWTHVLMEAERPVLGSLYGTAEAEATALEAAGLRVGHMCHGSDVRVPALHAQWHPFSPFRDARDPRVHRLQRVAAPNANYLRRCERPVFVSTPDLLDYVPGATWCPVVVDADAWAGDAPLLQRRRPRVVHVPSNGWLKGSDRIDPLMAGLHDAGLIEYRTLRGLDRAGMRLEYREADIVLDQFVLGLYGVAAAEAMAAGRVVVAYVGDTVRRRVREVSGEEIPIVEATPATLVEVVKRLVAEREVARRIAADGPAFVRRVHSARRAATTLEPFLR